MKIVVRPYADSDREAVTELWNLVFGPAADHNEPRAVIKAKVVTGDGLLFVADSKGRVVGTIMAGYDGHRGWLYTLAVHENSRRLGIGSRLIKHAEQELKARGCLKLNLQVRPTNSDAVAFYEAMGFQIEERISLGKRLT